ncbi:MAG TPA: septum formation family protein [Micromonospora sp.]
MGLPAATGLLASALLAGCDGADRVTGDQASRPTVGACYLNSQSRTEPPLPCEQEHLAETVHVGTFGEAAADADNPPASGTAPLRDAYATCDPAASRYVGSEWHGGRLAMTVVTPSASGWAAGERWYRCDLSEIDSLNAPVPQKRTGSLRGALTSTPSLRLGCFDPVLGADDQLVSLSPVSCDGPHHSEFAGIWPAPESPSGTADAAGEPDFEENTVLNGCAPPVARFVGVSEDEIRVRIGLLWWLPSGPAWAAGDRAVLCFLWSEKPLDRSLRGAGMPGLPES